MNKLFIYLRRTCLMACVALLAAASARGGEVRVLGQNVQNYFWNYQSTQRTVDNNPDVSNYSTDAGRARKTALMVSTLLESNADIFAFNELEACETILVQLADSMTKYGTATYRAVSDGISYVPDGYDNHLKSGFIYRTDRIRPVGSNQAATSTRYYCDVQRIQTFEEVATGERFTLSMNHLKQGWSSSDQQSRATSVSQLLQTLTTAALDPDILIIGDMNSHYGSEELNQLVDAGYEEQIRRFFSSASAYEDMGSIDHVFANSSMAGQVTDAKFWPENWYDAYYYDYEAYSDHQPYVVTLNLSSGAVPHECEDLSYSESFSTSVGGWNTERTASGTGYWNYYAKNSCLYVTGYNKSQATDAWVASPSFDLTGMHDASLSFLLRIAYGTSSNYQNNLRLYVTDNFTGFQTSQWTQLTGLRFGNWSGTRNTIALPDEFLGKDEVTIAFRYTSTNTSSDAPNVGINDLTLIAHCGGGAGLDEVRTDEAAGPRKVVIDGRMLILMPDGSAYDLLGSKVR